MSFREFQTALNSDCMDHFVSFALRLWDLFRVFCTVLIAAGLEDDENNQSGAKELRKRVGLS